MKPWIELTAMEKREAIALRLGFIGPIESRIVPGKMRWRYAEETYVCGKFPKDWPTDDGLAFTEVWPLILEADTQAELRMCVRHGKPLLKARACHLDFHAETWADAVCRAAYDLLPVPKESE